MFRFSSPIICFIAIAILFIQPTEAQRSIEKSLKKWNKESVPYIYPQNLEMNDDLILLDTRKKEEFEISHLKGAIWVGYKKFDEQTILDTIKNKTTPIVVYCSIGVRSENIGEKLLKLGYTNVKNLFGGIFECKNQDHKVYNPKGVATDSVHAFNKHWGKFLKKGIKVYKDH
ncbi:rhodanese-like domain-containing protein [Maribacter sp. MMG018]|uniref:rhodanese-like domain-containing protein n=1 Tax=Maribacter sp. MMG018 TaxID=2822688 RepID=UPI001B38E75D|nr:rhodanese-like domain-containing protein [Maribacter sp. MMG018]MBQ4912960.1 rhodanese-like domain-containing protein [Maribacter sp. MMG018]